MAIATRWRMPPDNPLGILVGASAPAQGKSPTSGQQLDFAKSAGWRQTSRGRRLSCKPLAESACRFSHHRIERESSGPGDVRCRFPGQASARELRGARGRRSRLLRAAPLAALDVGARAAALSRRRVSGAPAPTCPIRILPTMPSVRPPGAGRNDAPSTARKRCRAAGESRAARVDALDESEAQVRSQRRPARIDSGCAPCRLVVKLSDSTVANTAAGSAVCGATSSAPRLSAIGAAPAPGCGAGMLEPENDRAPSATMITLTATSQKANDRRVAAGWAGSRACQDAPVAGADGAGGVSTNARVGLRAGPGAAYWPALPRAPPPGSTSTPRARVTLNRLCAEVGREGRAPPAPARWERRCMRYVDVRPSPARSRPRQAEAAGAPMPDRAADHEARASARRGPRSATCVRRR